MKCLFCSKKAVLVVPASITLQGRWCAMDIETCKAHYSEFITIFKKYQKEEEEEKAQEAMQK